MPVTAPEGSTIAPPWGGCPSRLVPGGVLARVPSCGPAVEPLSVEVPVVPVGTSVRVRSEAAGAAGSRCLALSDPYGPAAWQAVSVAMRHAANMLSLYIAQLPGL